MVPESASKSPDLLIPSYVITHSRTFINANRHAPCLAKVHLNMFTRREFLALCPIRREEHLAQISMQACQIKYDRYRGFHSIAKRFFRKESVLHEEEALRVTISASELSNFCCLCSVSSEVSGFTLIDGDGFPTRVGLCQDCAPTPLAQAVVAWSKAWGRNSLGDMGTMIATVYSIQMLKRWQDRKLDFARLILLPFR